MILVDTSVWIDHLHQSDPDLIVALAADEVGQHPLVVQELAMGRLAERDVVLGAIGRLAAFPQLTHAEFLRFVEEAALWGRGLSPVDAHLLGAARLVSGSTLWTSDRRLRAAAVDLGHMVVG